MRSSILITLTSLAAASAFPNPPPPPGPPGPPGPPRPGPKYDFKPAGPHDSRGPCPMLNALANHGFFPRSGKNISIDQIVSGIDLALNLDPASSRPVAELGATTSTTGNPQTVNLADMGTHGIIEHDGSLSRGDFPGNTNRLNPAIYASYIARFAGKSVITIPDAAAARRARIAAARAINPNFVFTAREDEFSRFETSLYLAVFGTGTIGNAPKKWVDVMFREERIPYKEGYVRPTDVITNDDLVNLATQLITA